MVGRRLSQKHRLISMKRNQLFSGATRPFPHASFQRVDDSNAMGNFHMKQQRPDQSRVNLTSELLESNNGSNKSFYRSSEVTTELSALCQEVSMLRHVVLELKNELVDIKLSNEKKDEVITKLLSREASKKLTHDGNPKMNEEIDVNFDEYLSILQRKKLLQSSAPDNFDNKSAEK